MEFHIGFSLNEVHSLKYLNVWLPVGILLRKDYKCGLFGGGGPLRWAL